MTRTIATVGRILVVLCALALGGPAYGAPTANCGGQTSNGCACGKIDIYPCCGNGGNCTWYAWRSMCCHWNFGPGNWGNANTWAGNAKKNPNVVVQGNPVVGAIATRDLGKYGHVAYVVAVSGGKIKVEEQSCDYGPGGMSTNWYNASYFNSGFIVKKGSQGPSCGDNKCEGGENCKNCSHDCGGCCGNGACDWGENCGSCSQDCGSCCGNGACDWGETCESCNKDCKCLPAGSLDTANCSSIGGWAYDPDTPGKKLDVRVKCNGATQATVQASGPYPGHDGRGYQWSVPPQLKDGQVCSVTAEAQDADTSGFTTFGPKAFLCENKTTHEGIWTTTRQDAAGIGVQLPAGEHEGLLHGHAANYPYPLSGVIESCTQPGLDAYEELRATVMWNLQSKQHHVALRLDGVVRGEWQGDVGAAQDLALDGTGTEVCLRTTALAQVPAPEAAMFQLADLRWRTGPWWNGYSNDGAGLTIGHPDRDTVRMQVRNGALAMHGAAQSWLDLPEVFDTVRYSLTGHAAQGLEASLVVGAKKVPAQPGTQEASGLQGKRLILQAIADGPLPPDAAVTWQSVRVLQNSVRAEGPWSVARHNAWGLDAGVPDDATPSAAGLSLALTTKEMGWWLTGVVAASIELPGVPFERVRAQLHTHAPVGAKATPLPARLEVRVDDAPVATLPLAATEVQLLDIAANGHQLTVAFGLLVDQVAEPAIGARLDGLEFLRRGWWTAMSPKCAGLRDDRLDGGGFLLETVRAWGMAGHALQGHVRVHRTFGSAQTGVRFHYRQDLVGGAVRVVVLADGLPIAVFDDDGALAKDVELPPVTFTDLAFVLQPKQPGGIHPHHWWAEFTSVQTRGADGSWVTTKDAALPAPQPTLLADAGSMADTTGVQTAASPPPAGCAASPRALPTGLALLLLTLVAIGVRRRTSDK